MIKTILVGAAGIDGDAASYAAALTIARTFSAHLDVLHVKLDAVNTAVAMTTDAGGGTLAAGLIERLEEDARQREARAKAMFDQFCSGAGLAAASAPGAGGAAAPSAEWHVETGDEPRWIAAYGVAADLIVAHRGGADEVGARSSLETALLETGRPLLLPAASPLPARFERIAIAWKPTAQAARAVAMAMPFLSRAKEVLVVTVEEEAERSADAERLVRSLAWHGIAATPRHLEAGPEGGAASLLAGVSGEADLLVMGGYGHSRLREWVFGGFTQLVLSDAPLPVLLAH